jgi:hypothetical protein
MNSTDPLEKALRASLQPIDPGAAFTTALQTRLASEHHQALAVRSVHAFGARISRLHSASLALAASIVVALGVGWQLTDLRTAQEASQARVQAQLRLALEITGERLTQVQQRIAQFQSQENSL